MEVGSNSKLLDKAKNEDMSDKTDEVQATAYSEGGWGWIVVLASFMCVFVLDGIGYSFGVYLEPLIAELSVGRGVLSMAGSMQVGVYGFSSPFVAKIVNRYGERKPCIFGAVMSSIGLLIASLATDMTILIIGYSLICGIGFGLMYLPSVIIVSKHFLVRRSLATGIVLCAAGVGTFVVAPMAQLMLEQWGWRCSMRGLAAICLSCVICGATMSPGPMNNSGENSGDVGSVLEAVNRPCLNYVLGQELASAPSLFVFALLAAADMLSTLALYIPFTHLPSAAEAAGVSATNAALLVSVIGVSNTLGRLLAGWISDQPWGQPIVMITTAISCSVPALYLFTVVSNFWTFMCLSCIFGLLTGMWVSATPPAIIYLLGVHLLGPAFGLLTAIRGSAALAGPPIAGMVVDLVGDRQMALMVAGGVMTLSSLFYLISAIANRRRLVTRRGYEEI